MYPFVIRSACRNDMSCVCLSRCFLCLFESVFYVPVNSYGHVGMVSSPNNTPFLGKLDLVVDNQYFVYTLSLVTDNKVRKRAKIRNQEKEENGR